MPDYLIITHMKQDTSHAQLVDYNYIKDNLGPLGPRDLFIISPISWDIFTKVINILQINSNSIRGKNFDEAIEANFLSSYFDEIANKQKGIFFGSRSSFARAKRKMEQQELDFLKGSRIIKDYNSFFLGGPGVDRSESIRLILFLLDCLLRRIDTKIGLEINSKRFDIELKDNIENSSSITWLDQPMSFLFREYPYNHHSLELSPIEALIRNHFGGPIYKGIKIFTFGISIKDESIILNIFQCLCDFSEDLYESKADFHGGFVSNSENWTCFQFKIDDTLTLTKLNNGHELNSQKIIPLLHFSKFEKPNPFGFDFDADADATLENKDNNYECAKALKKPTESQTVNEYEIIDFLKKLNPRQISFLQDVMNLTKKSPYE